MLLQQADYLHIQALLGRNAPYVEPLSSCPLRRIVQGEAAGVSRYGIPCQVSKTGRARVGRNNSTQSREDEGNTRASTGSPSCTGALLAQA